MQNNWVSCLFIIQFIDNNIFLVLIKMTSFFINKNFYSRMSFSLNFTFYTLTQKHLQSAKIEVIIDFMKNILKIMIIKIKIVKNTIIMHINKHKKKVIYNKDNIIFLSSWNIKTTRLINKLKDKMLSLFWIKKLVDLFYQLKLLPLIKI